MNRHSRPLPAFGRMPLDRIGPEDVAAWFDAASKDKPGAANRAFEILRATMFRAEERGLRERGSNPCLGIAKNPRNHFARFLDADELARLGRALDTGEAEWPEAVAAIRLLALTGCRRSEVLNLRWRDIGEDDFSQRQCRVQHQAGLTYKIPYQRRCYGSLSVHLSLLRSMLSETPDQCS